MLYTRTVLDRATGELVTVNAGNWITVTELGEAYGVGPRRVRAILHHMGLLRPEGRHGRYRLAPAAVERGYGLRHDKPKHGHPFDVISPAGQALVAEAWNDTVAELEAETAAPVEAARSRLDAFKAQTDRTMTTQQEVCWLRDHFPALTYAAVAKIVSADERLVSRYAALQDRQRDFLRRRRDQALTTAHGLFYGIIADPRRLEPITFKDEETEKRSASRAATPHVSSHARPASREPGPSGRSTSLREAA